MIHKEKPTKIKVMIKLTPAIYLSEKKNLDMILSGWTMIDCLFFVIYYKKL